MDRASSWCAGAFKVVRISTLTTLILSAGFMLAQTAASSTQTFAVDANLDNSTKNLSTCVEPSCNPGGNPSGPTAYSSTVVATTPCGNPADGSALELSVTGPAYVNALWTYKMGAMNNATHFRLDFDACFDDSIATDQAFEADIALFVSGSPGWNYMFGGQCNLAAGVYDVWNQANPAWIPTAIPCSATTLSANQWHHFQREVHYDSSNALWFDYLCINGQCWGNTSLGKYSAGALPNGWGSTRIWQFQLDLGAAGGKTTMWLNNVTGSAWQ
jgi:hypothetical protein